MRISQSVLIVLALSTAAPALGQAINQTAPPAVAGPPAPSLTAEPETTAPAPLPPLAAARPRHAKGDPWERFNRSMFRLNQKFDHAIFRPLALTAGKIIPRPVRHGFRNFLRNLGEPIIFLNDLLQLKPKRALRTLARFTLNSTFGIGGLFDAAKKAKLPRHNNGFGNTLARYGVGPGPYLFLPLVGPTTLRDFGGQQIDRTVLPVGVGSPFNRLDWQFGTGAVAGIDQRITSDEDLRNLLSGAADPYATLRSVYLQSRLAEIADIKGQTQAPAMFDDPLDDPAAKDNTAPGTTPAPPEPTAPETDAVVPPLPSAPAADPALDRDAPLNDGRATPTAPPAANDDHQVEDLLSAS